MIEITEEMINTLRRTRGLAGLFEPQKEIRKELEPIFALIDPVPDDVRIIYIRENYDEFYRIIEGGNVWRQECGCCFITYAEIAGRAAGLGVEVTWENK